MLKLKQTLAAASAVAVGLAAGQVGAENLDLNEMAAALALPIITGGFESNPIKDPSKPDIIGNPGEGVTLITVTNGKSDNVVLKIDMISGDDSSNGGDNWQSTSFDCELTGRETTTFVIKHANAGPDGDSNSGGDSQVYVECSDGNDTNGAKKALFTGVGNGIMFIGIADPDSGQVISEDVIFGDAIVVDLDDEAAYSFHAIAFQAGHGNNNGDKVYRFDGGEYSKFPAVLASNFIAPTANDGIDTELILFTLDGTVGNLPVPRAKVGGFVFNDDEVAVDFTWEFDCFDIVNLAEVNQNFQFDHDNQNLGLGSMSGHLELIPQPIASPGPDAHDAQYGDSNNSRRRPVHGWIVTEFRDNSGLKVLPGNVPINGAPEVAMRGSDQAYIGRPLAQSTTSLNPFLADQHAVLDADVRN